MIFTEEKLIRLKGNSLLGNYNDYVIVDIETTGLDPQKDKIIELAALKIENNEVVKEYSSLINPNMEISSFVTNLTGIDNDTVRNSPTIEVELKNFLEFIGNDMIIGHNVNFDINFIYDNCFKYYNIFFENDYLDTLRMSRKVLSLENYKLKTLSQKFDINYENAHRALKDCYITFDVYNKLKELNNSIQTSAKKLINYDVPENNLYKNTKICVKGKIMNYGYEFLCEIAKKCNVNLISNVFFKDCDYLILGNNTYQRYLDGMSSEKLDKARELETAGTLKVISENEFYESNNIPLEKRLAFLKTNMNFQMK